MGPEVKEDAWAASVAWGLCSLFPSQYTALVMICGMFMDCHSLAFCHLSVTRFLIWDKIYSKAFPSLCVEVHLSNKVQRPFYTEGQLGCQFLLGKKKYRGRNRLEIWGKMCYHKQPHSEGGLIDLEFWLILWKILFISTPNSSCLMSVPISLNSISFIFQFSFILLVINQPRNTFHLYCVLSFFLPS